MSMWHRTGKRVGMSIVALAVVLTGLAAGTANTASAAAPRVVEQWDCTIKAMGVGTFASTVAPGPWRWSGAGRVTCPTDAQWLIITLSVLEDVPAGPDRVVAIRKSVHWFPPGTDVLLGVDAGTCYPGGSATGESLLPAHEGPPQGRDRRRLACLAQPSQPLRSARRDDRSPCGRGAVGVPREWIGVEPRCIRSYAEPAATPGMGPRAQREETRPITHAARLGRHPVLGQRGRLTHARTSCPALAPDGTCGRLTGRSTIAIRVACGQLQRTVRSVTSGRRRPGPRAGGPVPVA